MHDAASVCQEFQQKNMELVTQASSSFEVRRLPFN